MNSGLGRAPIVLASGSAARARMLKAAGVAFEVRPAQVDEEALIGSLTSEGAQPRDVADALAELKAVRASARMPGRLVLGADQVLSCGGEMFQKPVDRAMAERQLARFAGRDHDLWSAACLARDGAPVWRFVGRARLWMRVLTADFIAAYLDAAGDGVLACVGAYEIEGLGANLFAKIEGDVFTIQGLPLLNVLDALRTQGAIRA